MSKATLAFMSAAFLRFAIPADDLPKECSLTQHGYTCQVTDIPGILAEHEVRDGLVVGFSMRANDHHICSIAHAAYAKQHGTCMGLVDLGDGRCWDTDLVVRRWHYDGRVCEYKTHLQPALMTTSAWVETRELMLKAIAE